MTCCAMRSYDAVNTDNTVGAVGFTTRLAPRLYPVMLIKVDDDTAEPLRDRDGMCIRLVAPYAVQYTAYCVL